MEALVSTEWLAAELGAPDLRIIDASLFLPASGRDGAAEFEAAHIPGAVFLDLDELVDAANPAPHMLPPEHRFASRMQSLGIGDGHRIVVYDNSPLKSATRGWWMLKTFGSHYVAVLDGGFAKWKEEGRPVESGRLPHRHAHYTPLLGAERVADKAAVSAIVGSPDHELVDARSPGRFAAEEPEPRPRLPGGHIPGSRNVHYATLFEPDGRWKRGDALRGAFADAGVDLDKPMVATCGSGITAASLVFGAHLLGKTDVKLYDGSWSEWASDPTTPKATGPA